MMIIANISINSSTQNSRQLPVLVALFAFCGMYLGGCSWWEKSPSVKQTQQKPVVQLESNPQAIATEQQAKSQLNFLPYKGEFLELPRIEQEKKALTAALNQTHELLAKKAGIPEQMALTITIEFRDWQTQDNQTAVYLRPSLLSTQDWEITFVSENLFHQGNRSQLYQRTLIEAFLRAYSQSQQNQLPDWLIEGSLFYISKTGDWLKKKRILNLLSGKYQSYRLSDVIKGLAYQQKIFPDWEGYLALVYLEEKYGKDAIKKFLSQIFIKGQDWEKQLREISGYDFFTFQERAKLFAIAKLKNQFQAMIIRYRQALRFYLQKDYPNAVVHLQKLALQYQGTQQQFITANLYFWLGMCYYRLGEYSRCLDEFAKVYQGKQNFCSYLPETRYRRGMCFYHLQQLQRAIIELSEFRQSYPFHSFASSSLFFLAKIFWQRQEQRRAIHWCEEFIQKYPDHHRYLAALEMAGELNLQIAHYHKAKEHFQTVFDHPKASVAQKRNAAEKMNQIALVSQGPASEQLATSLDKMVEKYSTSSQKIQQEILNEMALIGPLALPWLEKIIELPAQNFEPLISTIQRIGAAEGSALLLKILRLDSKQSQEVFTALWQLPLPALQMKELIESKIQDFPPAVRKNIQKDFQATLFSAPSSLLEEFPQLLRLANSGQEAKQLQLIEQLGLQAGEEQVPVLHELALRGSDSVQRKALENLYVWKKQQTAKVYQRLLYDNDPQVRIQALQGLSELQEIPPEALEKLHQDPSPEVRLALMEVLRKISQPNKWKWIVEALKDSHLQVRNQAREILKGAKKSQAALALVEGFSQKGQPVSFYSVVVQLLEGWVGKIPYTPEMSQAERVALANKLKGNFQ